MNVSSSATLSALSTQSTAQPHQSAGTLNSSASGGVEPQALFQALADVPETEAKPQHGPPPGPSPDETQSPDGDDGSASQSLSEALFTAMNSPDGGADGVTLDRIRSDKFLALLSEIS